MTQLFGDQIAIPCSLFRGGTSKGVLFLAKDLPSNQTEHAQLLMQVMGSPDARQIDGLGGADPLTSRVAIISKSQKNQVDIDYQFGFVHIEDPIVEFSGFCGNIISAVGPFAINEGLVKVTSPITHVRILDLNTQLHVTAEVPVYEGKAQTKGTFSIAGVPTTGACIKLHFHHPVRKLLPTGNPIEPLHTSFGTIPVSLIDCIDPVVFVRAKDIDLVGNETPADMELKKPTLEKLEELRHLGAEKMGVPYSGYLPKVAFISPTFPQKQGHLFARMTTLKKIHKAYAVSCAACTAAAAFVPGSLVNEAANPFKDKTSKIVIHHPLGEMVVAIKQDHLNAIETITMTRTARCLMKGLVMVTGPKAHSK